MIIEDKMLEVIKKIANAKKEAKKAINQIAAYEYEQEIRKLTDELAGLYDALECRPAVQVTKTIEERAEEAQTRDLSEWEDYLLKYCSSSFEFGYVVGATDQRKIDIDKACEWIYEHRDWYVETEDNGISGKLSDDFFAEFRKAMEE